MATKIGEYVCTDARSLYSAKLKLIKSLEVQDPPAEINLMGFPPGLNFNWTNPSLLNPGTSYKVEEKRRPSNVLYKTFPVTTQS